MNRKSSILFVALLTLCGCANRGVGPQGGPKDVTPPTVVKETPANGSVNCVPKSLDLQFNEYLQLDRISDNLIVCPPQQRPPEVKAVGKKVHVEFMEPLKDSTTYTLNFGDAICDYNEKNPVRNYSFSFATGPTIDSLFLSGRVVWANNLNPVSSVLAGVQENLDDSAFTSVPFVRISRTDSAGAFRIQNMHEGKYRLYGLKDVSRDYEYQPGEALAFSDSVYSPSDSSLILWLFQEEKKHLYFKRLYRDEPHRIRLVFGSPQDSLPLVTALRPSQVDTAYYEDSLWVNPLENALLQFNVTRDTLVYWLRDSASIAQDSIFLSMSYYKSDSLYRPVLTTDTLRAIYRAPRTDKAREALAKKNQARRLTFISNAKPKFDVYDTLMLRASCPVDSFDVRGIHLDLKKDSLFTPVAFNIVPVDSSKLTFHIVADMAPESDYRLTVDSAAMRDIYGVTNLKKEFAMHLKSVKDYATLMVQLPNFDPSIRIQLLNSKDAVVRELPADEKGTQFIHLIPQVYYLRLYIDSNHDGLWTTGDWAVKRQPEPVYYFPNKLTLKANWDFEESFDYIAVPQLQAKPKELISNGQKKQ